MAPSIGLPASVAQGEFRTLQKPAGKAAKPQRRSGDGSCHGTCPGIRATLIELWVLVWNYMGLIERPGKLTFAPQGRPFAGYQDCSFYLGSRTVAKFGPCHPALAHPQVVRTRTPDISIFVPPFCFGVG